jgi:hypothetical protein
LADSGDEKWASVEMMFCPNCEMPLSSLAVERMSHAVVCKSKEEIGEYLRWILFCLFCVLMKFGVFKQNVLQQEMDKFILVCFPICTEICKF